MKDHAFIFSPGLWLGEGKITMNMVEEELFFGLKWIIQEGDFAGKVRCSQEIQIQGLGDHMNNELIFYDFLSKGFQVDMENQNVGCIVGNGLCDEKMIGWEFRDNANFEGYETYTLQEDGSYVMKGEYITTDQFRTQIEARIWLHSKEVPSSDEIQENGEEF